MLLTVKDALKKIILIGDKVLIKPKDHGERTATGLYLPQTVLDKEPVQSGYILNVGPGFPIPTSEEPEPWKAAEQQPKYLPLQVKEGDLAIFLQKHAFEVVFEGEKYLIVPQHAILMLVRDEI
jgi:co-chaperonin GroES (HSP10)